MTNLTANPTPAGEQTLGGGAYIQPSPGVVVQGVTFYKDGQLTVQGAGKQTAPTAATVVATCTPGTAGLWEITGSVAISGTTTVAADSHNTALNQTSTARLSPIPFGLISTTGASGDVKFGPVILNLSATDTVNITAIANATASSVYAAAVVARLVG